MSTVFGESGPKHVEVLAHPTRRQSNIGPPAPATVGQAKRMSLDSEMAAAEAGDHFEMMPPPSQQPAATRTWAAARTPAFSPQLSGSGGGLVRTTRRQVPFSVLPRACARRAQAAVGRGGRFFCGGVCCRRLTIWAICTVPCPFRDGRLVCSTASYCREKNP